MNFGRESEKKKKVSSKKTQKSLSVIMKSLLFEKERKNYALDKSKKSSKKCFIAKNSLFVFPLTSLNILKSKNQKISSIYLQLNKSKTVTIFLPQNQNAIPIPSDEKLADTITSIFSQTFYLFFSTQDFLKI